MSFYAGFSSHRKKRMKQIKKMSDRGLLTSSKDDPFELFVSSTSIRYCYYKETQKILGNTFGTLSVVLRGCVMRRSSCSAGFRSNHPQRDSSYY